MTQQSQKWHVITKNLIHNCFLIKSWAFIVILNALHLSNNFGYITKEYHHWFKNKNRAELITENNDEKTESDLI